MHGMGFVRKNILLFVVFITGACVLVIEVVAVRILSPYYGNTIFSVSSVISVILAALSVGYYFGGRFADRHPSAKWFYGIIVLSGFSIFILEALIVSILPFFGYKLSITTGPLITSLILFFVPAVLLGTLSPFAIKLHLASSPKDGIGSIAGKVFFWSTFGSIVGSLLTGFVLIPHFGVNVIVLATGAVLTSMGLIAFWYLRFEKKNILKIAVGVLVVAAILLYFFAQPLDMDTLYSRDGVYEKVTIYEQEKDGELARFLLLDRAIAGAMFVNSNKHVYEYSEYYSIYEVLQPKLTHVLVLGGGAYTMPRELFYEVPNIQIDVVEIEPSLFELAKEFFALPDDPRLKNYVEDGRRFLYDTETTYDFIVSDVYHSVYSIPMHFTTKEFFQLAKEKLNSEGIFLANIISSLSPDASSLFITEVKTFQSVFPNSYFFATESPDYMGAQNILFVGYNSENVIDFQNEVFKKHSNEIIRQLGEKEISIEQFDFAEYQIFTDNFAPVEYFTSEILRAEF